MTKYFFGAALIVLITVLALRGAHIFSLPSQFEKQLIELQRDGSCTELPRFGVSTHQYRNPDSTNIELVSDIAAQVVRFDIFWTDVERAGLYDFRKYDRLIQGLRQKNKMVLLLLTYDHPDHSDASADGSFLPPRTAEQREAYYRYVRAVVKRYHGPDIAYQIWNETNMKEGLTSRVYGELLTETARVIREVDLQAIIIAAGLANERDPDNYLHGLVTTTDLTQVDALAFHPYRQNGPENSLSDIAKFESASSTNNAPRALWITEWGYSETWLLKSYSADKVRKRQAIMIARLMLTAAIAKTKVVTIYDLIDDGPDITNQEHKFGLYDFEFKPKEAAVAFRILANLMANCDQYRFEFNMAQKTIIATFEKNRGATRVIWTYDSGRDREICVDLNSLEAVNLIDIFGNRIGFNSCGSGSSAKITISEPIGPIILTSGN
jgi:hypothetical protein